MDIKTLIGEGKDLVEKVKADPDAYAAVLAKGQDALLRVQAMIQKLRTGDFKAVEAQLTEWDDVNDTLRATAAVQGEIERGKNAVSVDDVLAVVQTVGKIALVAAKLAGGM